MSVQSWAMSMAQGGGFVQGFAGSAIGAVGGLAANDVSVQLGGTGYGDGITELQLVRAAISAAAGCAASAAAGGKCAPAAVTAAFASLYNGDGGWSKYGWAALEIGGGFIPGVGEAQDLSVLFGKDSSGFERFFAGASLVVNVLTGGLAPNAGSYIRGANHLSNDVIHVTKEGVALPADAKYAIPAGYVQNAKRTGSYGEVIDGRFVERLRIDPATPPGMKGPNYSHYHINGGGRHYSPQPGDKDPGFPK